MTQEGHRYADSYVIIYMIDEYILIYSILYIIFS